MRIKHSDISTYTDSIDFLEANSDAINQVSIASLKDSDFLQKWETFKQLFFYTHGNFNVIDLLFFAIEQMQPARVWLSSFSFTNHVADQLNILYQDKKIAELNLMLDWRVKLSRPDLISQLNNIADEVILNKNHSKLILLCSQDGKECLSIISSANMNNNPRNEAGVITKDKSTFEFYQTIFENEINKYHATYG